MRSTYRQGDFPTLSDLLGENTEKIQDAGVAFGAVAKGGDDGLENVGPIFHLDRQDSQAHAKLHSNRLGSGGVMLKEEKQLVSKSRKLAGGNLRRQVICDLEPSV